MNKKILLVDDDPINLKLVKFFLDSEGHICECADDGESGWQMMEKNNQNYSLVVIDRIMPRMNAVQFINKMNSSGLLEKIPVIVLTGVADKEETIEVIKSGAFDILIKPLDKHLLLSAVKRAYKSIQKYQEKEDFI